MTGQSRPILEPEALAELQVLGGASEANVSVRFVRLFLDEAQSLVCAMRLAVSSGDAASVSHAAHALRGAAGFVGASRLVAAAWNAELAADASGAADLGPLIADLDDELAVLRPVVLAAIGPEVGPPI